MVTAQNDTKKTKQLRVKTAGPLKEKDAGAFLDIGQK